MASNSGLVLVVGALSIFILGNASPPAPPQAVLKMHEAYQLFNHRLAECAADVMAKRKRDPHESPAQYKEALAATIWTALMGLQDTQHAYTIRSLGFGVHVLVWEAEIRAGYEDIFKLGEPQNTAEMFPKPAQNGAVQWNRCMGKSQRWDMSSGDLGLPCRGGNSVFAAHKKMSCMIFYVMRKFARAREVKLRALHVAMKTCFSGYPAIFDPSTSAPIDLTKLSVCIFEHQSKTLKNNPSASAFRGMAIVPAYFRSGLGQSGPTTSQDTFGVYSYDGKLFTEHLDMLSVSQHAAEFPIYRHVSLYIFTVMAVA